MSNEAVQKFRKHYSDKSRTEKQKLVESEFEELKYFPNEKSYHPKNQAGSQAKFKEYNRYRDIIPYDSTRVKLNHCDYVNASWVGPDKTYIATQGPKEFTVRHFWEVVIQYKVEVVVMLCNLQEYSSQGMMKEKCARYWPESDQIGLPGDGKIKNVKLRILKEEKGKNFIKREISYTHGSSHSRKVYQFQMVNWPDHGVPKNGEHVFDLIHTFRNHQKEVQNPKVPILLHCSAGVGRTGTVIAIDRVMQLINSDTLPPDFSVFNLIKELRKARPKMCQTEEQYGFIYEMVEKLFIKCKLLSSKEKKRKAPSGNQVSERGRRSSERRPHSEYHHGNIRREDRRKSRSLQRLNAEMEIEDFKSNNGNNGIISRKGRHHALRERVMEPTPMLSGRLSPPDSFQDNESDLSESELINGPGPETMHKYPKPIEFISDDKVSKEEAKSKGFWPRIKDVFRPNQSPRKDKVVAISLNQTTDDLPRNVSQEYQNPGTRSSLPARSGQTSSPPSKTPKTNPVKWLQPKQKKSEKS